jgi:hypothetical protein
MIQKRPFYSRYAYRQIANLVKSREPGGAVYFHRDDKTTHKSTGKQVRQKTQRSSNVNVFGYVHK